MLKIKNKWTDKKFQEYLIKKNPYCLLCGDLTVCHHHFFHKGSNTQLRYTEENLIPVCNNCHLLIHNKQRKELEEIIINKKGKEWYNNLRIKKNI